MTQELLDLRRSLVEGRYEDALLLVDELEGMGKQAILRNIESFLVRLLVHLLKNQVEQRLTHSWLVSISDSILQISKLNLRDNKTSYYIKSDEWVPYLDDALEEAILPASLEALEGKLKPTQFAARIDRDAVLVLAQRLLNLTYAYPRKELPSQVNGVLARLPGGQDWFEDT
ncbi:MAG: DUF29 family protein [Cyanobacteria bacterium P01_D01_bin.44]